MRARKTNIARTIIGVTSTAIVAVSATIAPAQLRVVSPASVKNIEGDINVSSTGGPGKVQYLFPASDFAALPASHRLLVSWNFRGDASQSVPVDWTFDEKLWMSTTDKVSLTSVFDDNHGPDKTLVHDGTISYPILASGPAEGPREFTDGMRLQTPFFYDPSKGNLLIEEIAVQHSVPFPGPHLDFQSSVDVGVVAGFANSTSGTPFNVTAIIQFVFVPAPSAGDYNNDGTVDAADYVVWRKGLGTTYTQADYDAWRANFGKTAGSGQALPSAEPLPAAVPEPTSAFLAALSCLGFAVLQWRTKSSRCYPPPVRYRS